jgi:hypothetical protein
VRGREWGNWKRERERAGERKRERKEERSIDAMRGRKKEKH